MKRTKSLILRIHELNMLFRLAIAWILHFGIKDEQLWLISERGHDARDNGYRLFQWIKQHYPEINTKYIISTDSKDTNKLSKWSDSLIEFNSLRHLISIWNAKYLISTHICGYTPNLTVFSKIDRKYHIFKSKKKVFLQHGIIKDILPPLFADKLDIALFICGSAIEHQYILDKFGYKPDIAKYTGLCRFDYLHDFETKQTILIMPTFRIYVDRDHFKESYYFKAYSELLTNKQFQEILAKHDFNAIFYPHYEFQSNIRYFKELILPNNITIADMNYDVQTLLKESAVLITDFSSVFFDMMYMKKTTLFYQFDEERYRKAHYQEGYLNYRDVGPVAKTLEELLTNIASFLNGTMDTACFRDYANTTFPKRDCNNCQRVFDAIRQIE